MQKATPKLGTMAGMKRLLAAALFVSSASLATAALADVTPLVGVYTLPMPAGMSDLSIYELPQASWSIENERIKFIYRMPADLVGKEDYDMVMTGDATLIDQNDFFPMVCGRTGSTAYCSKQGKSVVCSIHFRNLGIVPAEVTSFLETKYGVSAATDRRKQASSVVQSDAVGALSMTLLDPATEP